MACVSFESWKVSKLILLIIGSVMVNNENLSEFTEEPIELCW